MNKAPFSFELKYNNINLSEYPSDAQALGGDKFKQHLREMLEREYRSLEGNLDLKFSDTDVIVSWAPNASGDDLKNTAISLLQSGDITQGASILESMLESSNDEEVYYNLGMVYSDQGRFEEAIKLLSRATEIDSKYVHAWVALGVANLRAGNIDLAEDALKQSVSLDSQDPYALRTLAIIHMQKEDHISAISMLRNTLSLLPGDANSLLNLAMCLVKTGQEKDTEEAGAITQALLLSSNDEGIKAKAKEIESSVVQAQFRQDPKQSESSDAVFYCIDALKKLKDLDQKAVAEIALEVAQLGQNGLQISNSDITYTINTLPGKFTGLALVCLLHCAIQQVSPGSSSGFDVQKEYEIADKLVNKP